MYKFGLGKSIIIIGVFVIGILLPLYTYVFVIKDKYAYVLVATLLIMSIISIFTLLYKVYVTILESAFEFEEYCTFKRNRLTRNILEIANVILFLLGVLTCIYESYYVISLVCLYLNTLSIGLIFMLNRYNFLINTSSIIFIGKERYVNIKLDQIRSTKIKELNKKDMITIDTREGEWVIYTSKEDTKKIVDKLSVV